MKYFKLFLSEAVNIDNILFTVFSLYVIRFYIKLNDCFDRQIMIVQIQYCVDGTGKISN